MPLAVQIAYGNFWRRSLLKCGQSTDAITDLLGLGHPEVTTLEQRAEVIVCFLAHPNKSPADFVNNGVALAKLQAAQAAQAAPAATTQFFYKFGREPVAEQTGAPTRARRASVFQGMNVDN
ncbi:hypothetical protein TeGR_g6999 [Tetraparma gracilis]|uniref:Uncharacterized protein n=1 Tax=Tetraparma gracilis TaxID=2962635 RepID=A0ABQ6MDF8_9STRA|nr:hypothetical protein TeGR_g6999 [Tetraparma gracilis]